MRRGRRFSAAGHRPSEMDPVRPSHTAVNGRSRGCRLSFRARAMLAWDYAAARDFPSAKRQAVVARGSRDRPLPTATNGCRFFLVGWENHVPGTFRMALRMAVDYITR